MPANPACASATRHDSYAGAKLSHSPTRSVYIANGAKICPPQMGTVPRGNLPSPPIREMVGLAHHSQSGLHWGLSGGGRSCSGRENKTLYLKHKISRCFSNQGKEKAECLVGWGRAVVEWIPEPKGSSVWTPSSLQLGVRGAPCGCFCSLQLSNILI